jgi:hypothetical protein
VRHRRPESILLHSYTHTKGWRYSGTRFLWPDYCTRSHFSDYTQAGKWWLVYIMSACVAAAYTVHPCTALSRPISAMRGSHRARCHVSWLTVRACNVWWMPAFARAVICDGWQRWRCVRAAGMHAGCPDCVRAVVMHAGCPDVSCLRCTMVVCATLRPSDSCAAAQHACMRGMMGAHASPHCSDGFSACMHACAARARAGSEGQEWRSVLHACAGVPGRASATHARSSAHAPACMPACR